MEDLLKKKQHDDRNEDEYRDTMEERKREIMDEVLVIIVVNSSRKCTLNAKSLHFSKYESKISGIVCGMERERL